MSGISRFTISHMLQHISPLTQLKGNFINLQINFSSPNLHFSVRHFIC